MTIQHTVVTRVWDEASGGFVNLSVEITIDLDKLAFDLGRKARGSKYGKSRAMRGAVNAKVERAK